MAIDMDAAEIRKWAWVQAQRYSKSEGGTGHQDRLAWADNIAAWAMSGTLPEDAPEPEPQTPTDSPASGGDS